MRVVVDSVGRLLGVAWADTVLTNGQRIVDVSPVDYDRLLSGNRIGSTQDVLDQNRAFRDNPQLDDFLAIPPATVTTAAEFFAAVSPNALLRLLQLLVMTERSDKRQLNTLIRAVVFHTDPSLIVTGDDDFGPGT